tara:strand:+ start:422 stop:754 length:333 start_codon:yes stop_codon:yes gene_type:complete
MGKKIPGDKNNNGKISIEEWVQMSLKQKEKALKMTDKINKEAITDEKENKTLRSPVAKTKARATEAGLRGLSGSLTRMLDRASGTTASEKKLYDKFFNQARKAKKNKEKK